MGRIIEGRKVAVGVRGIGAVVHGRHGANCSRDEKIELAQLRLASDEQLAASAGVYCTLEDGARSGAPLRERNVYVMINKSTGAVLDVQDRAGVLLD